MSVVFAYYTARGCFGVVTFFFLLNTIGVQLGLEKKAPELPKVLPCRLSVNIIEQCQHR
jgi:hypothetical protein